MLIVLEGPDGAGKTTLTRQLERILTANGKNVVTLHAGPPSSHPLDEYEMTLVMMWDAAAHDRSIICDRWHLGETVYPAVLRRQSGWNTAIERHLYMFMQSRGAYVVLLRPSIERLIENVTLNEDLLIKVEQLHELMRRYDDLDSRHFNLVIDTYAASVPFILKNARHVAENVEALRKFETYVGPPRPRILLLGDRRGADDELASDVGMPAFMPYPATSGYFLLTYLDVITHNIGIANACDVDDPVSLWRTLDFPTVCALGKNAHERLEQFDIPHGVVPHPQYVRRFLFTHGNEYAHVIMEATVGGRNMLSWRP